MNKRIEQGAAILAVLCSLVQIAFQTCLAAGAPWGKAAWGGGSGTLPKSLRVASSVAVFVYTFVLSLFLQRISKIFDGVVVDSDTTGTLSIHRCQFLSTTFVNRSMWTLTVLLYLATLENFASRSPLERFTWGPFCFVFATCCLVLAKSNTGYDTPTSSAEETTNKEAESLIPCS